LFAGLLVGGLAILYAIVVLTGRRFDGRGRLLDAASFCVGAVALVVLCGTFARAHGGPFLFFKPSFDAMSSISTSASRPPDNAWLRVEPRLLVPLFLLAFVAVSWRRFDWRRDIRARLAAGSFAFLGVVSVVLAVWEFGGAGDFLFLTPYFRLLTVGFVLCTAAGVALFLARSGLEPDERWLEVAGLALVAGAVPTLVIYAGGKAGYTGRPAMVIVAALMMVTLGACAFVPRLTLRLRRLGVPLVVALAVFAANLAGAASSSTVGFTAATFSTATGSVDNPQAEGPAAMSVARRFVDFMQREGIERRRPAFWFDGRRGASVANGLASLYLYGYWTVAKNMPATGQAFRGRLRQLAPETLVLLCERRDCAGAPHALRAAGYRSTLRAAKQIADGPISVYVRAYDLSVR
jgi:hypothetical protein